MNEITLGATLYIYFFLVIILFILAHYFVGIHVFSAVVLSIFIGLLFLSVMYVLEGVR